MSPRSRHIPAAIRREAMRREVMRRDGGRCVYRSPDGRVYGSDDQIELHHVHPFAGGGPHEAANLELRCRTHNPI